MEKGSPFIPGERPAETEPQTPELTDESLEATSEIAVDEEYLTVDAIDRHSQESVERKLAQEEPFELIHGRKTEVMDEPTSSPVSIGSIIDESSKRVIKAVKKPNNSQDSNKSKNSARPKSEPHTEVGFRELFAIYKKPIIYGFVSAAPIIVVLYVWLFT